MKTSGQQAVGSRQKILSVPGSPTIEPVADGVWLIRGGLPRTMNVYLLEEEGGVVTVVPGHGHTNHRASAPQLDAPVYCHPDEVEDAEGSGGFRYWPDLRHSELPSSARMMQPLLHHLHRGHARPPL